MIFQGSSNTKIIKDYNQELAELHGYLNDDDARKSLCKFLRQNLGFTIELMTGKRIFPFQELVIHSMFSKDFFLLLAGRGLSKSWTTAQFAWLYAVMTPGVRIGILSKSFRQAQFILNYINDFALSQGGELLRACFKANLSKKNDIWTLDIGSSRIHSLPLGEGSKLRGFRFNVILIDELSLMPEHIINEVIMPFIAVNFDPRVREEISNQEDELIERGLMSPEERTEFVNPKFIGISSTGYQFEYLYELYKEYCDKINKPFDEQGRAIDTSKYGVMQLSWEVAPKFLYNEETIRTFKATMSEQQFKREFEAVFLDDSGGFFSRKKMDQCTVEIGNEPTIEIIGEEGAKYVLSIDPSFSKSEAADHYAMSLFKLREDKRDAVMVHNYAVAGGKLQDHMRYFSYLLRYFNIVYVIIDNMGHWFIDECNASVIFKEHNLHLDFFEADFENVDFMKGLRISKDSYNLSNKNICHAQKFSGEWIRTSNEKLAAAFDHQKLWFAAPAFDEKYEKLKKAQIPLTELVYNNRGEPLEGAAKKADFIEHQTDLIDMVKSETALIEIKSTSTGIQTFNLPQKLRRDDKPNRARKDNYTTLLMGNYAVLCYYQLMYSNIQEFSLLKPFFIK